MIQDYSEHLPAYGKQHDEDVLRAGQPRPAVTHAIRYVLFLTAGCLFVWPFFDPRFLRSNGDFSGLILLPISIALASLALSISIGTVWRAAGGWFSLMLVGQSVSLQLVNAGWQLRYQHYKPFSEITGSSFDLLLFAFICVQALVVVAGLRPYIGMIAAWVSETLGYWRFLLIAAIFVISTTTVSRELAMYLAEWTFAVFIQTVSLGTVVMLAISIPKGRTAALQGYITKFFGATIAAREPEPGPPDRFACVLAGLVVIAASALCVLSYERFPHVPDEATYLTQANMFANGVASMPAPPVRNGFEVYLMDYAADRWFPVTPPGWPAILALGAYVGLAWLVNPILAGLNVILVYVFLRELFPRNVSRVSVFLLAFSPWYIFLGMSFMTHMSSLTFALLAAIGVAWSRRSGKVSWALAAGFAVGIISLIRPLEAVAIAGLLGLWAIGLGGRRLKAGATAALILGTLATGSLGLAYNAAVGGSAFRFPINKYTDEHFGKNSNAYGFGPDRGMGWELDPNPGHGPIDALINSNLNASALNTELFGWPIGSFLLAAIGLCIARLDRGDYLMLAVIAAIYFLHFFYYFSGGPDFGARYWFLMIVPLVVLSARGMYKLAASLEGRFEGASARVFATVIAMCAITLLLFVPWRAVDKYRGFRGMSPEIGALARSHGFGSGLVLVQGKMDPDYAAAAVLNPLDLGGDATIYAWDRDPETRSALLAAYPGRPVWIVKGPSLTARGYEIVDGPLSAKEAERSIEPAN